MLFAGCSSCRSIAPLWCAGQFMPHMPVAVEPSPGGPYCQFCGPMPLIFTCMTCGTRQGLYMPGAPAPSGSFFGSAPLVAPVVQAPQAASQGQVHDLLVDLAGKAVTAVGKEVGHELMGAWTR